ncbi:transposase [Micromonospora tulbaghiae]
MWACWRDVAAPKPYPREFRDDVVRLARDREPGVTVEQIAKDFGVHPTTFFKWLRQVEVDAGAAPGTASTEAAELREARKRIRLLEQAIAASPRSDRHATGDDKKAAGHRPAATGGASSWETDALSPELRRSPGPGPHAESPCGSD